MSRKPTFPHKILWNPTRTRLSKQFKPCRIPHLLSEPSSFWSLVLFSRFAIQVGAEATPLSTSFLPLSLAPQGFASEEDRSREEVVAKATLSDQGRRRNKVPLIHLLLLSCRNSLRRKRDDATSFRSSSPSLFFFRPTNLLIAGSGKRKQEQTMFDDLRRGFRENC